MLDEWGRVAEATASCAVILRLDGEAVTPPPTKGCLDSITVHMLEAATVEIGTSFARRPLDRTEQ